MSENRIRVARISDAAELAGIYAPYVEKTAITFEYTPPTAEEFEKRIARTLEKYPYLVAERDGEIVGYAYAGAFNEREAYSRAAEVTVYAREDRRKMGIGGALYETLEKILSEQNILNLIARVAYPTAEDERLTKNSAQFHEHIGYRRAGEFIKCGYKFGRWYNLVCMEKHIGKHTDAPPEFKRFSEIKTLIAEKYGIL